LILNIMLGKLQNCNKGTRVPEVTSNIQLLIELSGQFQKNLI